MSERRPFDVQALRAEFPALAQEVYRKPLVYLDNAATTQKPQRVLDAYLGFLSHDNANVHRGVHALASRSTKAYEQARSTVARALGAPEARDVIFVRGTTEAVNLVAETWGRENVGPGDEILVTALEHHSNFVPWQRLAAARGARFVVVPVETDGSVSVERFTQHLTARTRLAAFAHVSNALGTVLPVAELTRAAQAVGARVFVDGAQAMSHLEPNVLALGCDFYAFSGHKVFAPPGIGALWARRELLEAMPPWQSGGEMVATVTEELSTWGPPPTRFEAGTPNFAGAVALGAALEWRFELDFVALQRHEAALLAAATARVSEIPGARILGEAPGKVSVLSFVIDGLHASDLGMILDRDGVAIRVGTHCTQPLLARFGLTATARASFALYNTLDDVERFGDALNRAVRMLRTGDP